MAYLSAGIQWLFHPNSIAELILRHRQIIFLMSFIFSLFFVRRFGPYMLLYIIPYELSKFYVFGDRFLAESIVGYLLVYLLAVNLELINKRVRRVDYVLVPIASFAAILLREPYVIASFVLFCLFVYLLKKQHKKITFPILTFFILTAITLFTINLYEYYFNIYVVNKSILGSELNKNTILLKGIISFFYPLYMIFSPEGWSFIRTLVAPISLIFAVSLFFYIKIYRKWSIILLIIFILFLSNLRPTEASRSFYEAFNISVWTQLLFYSSAFLMYKIYSKNEKAAVLFFVFVTVALFQFVTNKNYFAYEKVNPMDEFFTNYSLVMDNGTRIRGLANKNDTLFVDGIDDLIILEANLPTSYKFAWYTSFMPNIKRYRAARDEMFQKNPPTFYYGKCIRDLADAIDGSSKILNNQYIQLNPLNDKKCILIRKSKIPKITDRQKETLKNTKYRLP